MYHYLRYKRFPWCHNIHENDWKFQNWLILIDFEGLKECLFYQYWSIQLLSICWSQQDTF